MNWTLTNILYYKNFFLNIVIKTVISGFPSLYNAYGNWDTYDLYYVFIRIKLVKKIY